MKLLGRLRGLDRVVAGALLLGAVGLLIWLISSVVHINVDPGDAGPYPSFGPDSGRRYLVVALVYAAIWLKLTVQEVRRSSSATSSASLVLCLFLGLVMAAACLGVCQGLDCLNAWLDFSRPTAVPVLVQARRSEKRHTKYGAPQRVSIARVTRLDHPGPVFDVPWDSCQVPSPAVASPLATVNVGRGALGVPWIALPVVCHPLEVAERPLTGAAFLGRGAPVVLMTVKTSEASDPAAPGSARVTVPRWIDAVNRARPGISVVVIYDGPVPDWASTVCGGDCRSVSQYDVDRDILTLFLGRQALDDQIHLADGKGRRVYSVPLSDLDQTSELAARVKALAGDPTPGFQPSSLPSGRRRTSTAIPPPG